MFLHNATDKHHCQNVPFKKQERRLVRRTVKFSKQKTILEILQKLLLGENIPMVEASRVQPNQKIGQMRFAQFFCAKEDAVCSRETRKSQKKWGKERTQFF